MQHLVQILRYLAADLLPRKPRSPGFVTDLIAWLWIISFASSFMPGWGTNFASQSMCLSFCCDEAKATLVKCKSLDFPAES